MATRRGRIPLKPQVGCVPKGYAELRTVLCVVHAIGGPGSDLACDNQRRKKSITIFYSVLIREDCEIFAYQSRLSLRVTPE